MINVGIKFPNDGDFCNHDVIFNELTYIFSYPTESHPERIPKPIHFYGVPKYPLPKKMFGIFKHKVYDHQNPIFRGFDDEFYVPHSRHTEVRKADIEKVPELTLLSESEESGVYMVMARSGREFFITGHSEYSPYTLDTEYHRDLDKGLPIEMPVNYYRNDNPEEGPLVRWRGHANLLFSNWLNYFVYQQTPYDIREIR